MWNGTILPSMPMNDGQMQADFHVVMAGVNAYVKDIAAPGSGTGYNIPGYDVDVYYHSAAVVAPPDCNGAQTYLGVARWEDGRFEVGRCIAACEATPDCHFMNTYEQRLNNIPYGQHCAMYSAYWPPQYVHVFSLPTIVPVSLTQLL
jgi:hypothetical protein